VVTRNCQAERELAARWRKLGSPPLIPLGAGRLVHDVQAWLQVGQADRDLAKLSAVLALLAQR
jgi:hypothetical protein